MIRVLTIAALCAAVALVGVARAEDAKKFDKPEAAFDALNAAMKKKDGKGILNAMTPEGGDTMLGFTILGAAGARFKAKQQGEEAEKKVAGLSKAMEKSGLKDEEILKVLVEIGQAKGDSKKVMGGVKKLADSAKDKPATLGALMEELEKIQPKKDKGEPKLKDVKIDGDKASGTATIKEGDNERNVKFTFKKIDKGWRVEFPLDMLGGK